MPHTPRRLSPAWRQPDYSGSIVSVYTLVAMMIALFWYNRDIPGGSPVMRLPVHTLLVNDLPGCLWELSYGLLGAAMLLVQWLPLAGIQRMERL